MKMGGSFEYERISERHRYVTEELVTNLGGPIPPCKVCGKTVENHWFPSIEQRVNERVQKQVDDIVDEYNRRLLE